MGFTSLDKFTYLKTFMMELAQSCLDNGGPTVLKNGTNNFLCYFGDNKVFKIPKRPLQRFCKMVRDLPPCRDTYISPIKGINSAHLTNDH